MDEFNVQNIQAHTAGSYFASGGSQRISKVVTEKFDEEGRVIERTTTEYVYTPVGYTINNATKTNLREDERMHNEYVAPPQPAPVRIGYQPGF
jgi:hypothetical protein